MGQCSASNEQQQVRPGGCCEQNVSRRCHDEGKENGTHAGPVIEPASKCGTDRNASQGKSAKETRVRVDSYALVDREESQIGATYSITGADKQDGDGDK